MRNTIFHKIFFTIAGLTGAGIIIIFTSRYGIGLSPDSVSYISAARHISEGTGFINYDGYYFVLQAPLYPLLLAAFDKIFLIDPLISAGYLNAFFMGLTVYFSALFLRKKLDSSPLVVLAVLTIIIFFALLKLFLIALSEPLFILLIILYLYFFDFYAEKGNLLSLIIISVVSSLICLTRYAGVIIIPAGLISIIIWGKSTYKEKFGHSAIYLIITVIPSGFWIIRNYILTGTFTGQRALSSYTLTENIQFYFNTVLKWYMPVQLSTVQLFLYTFILIAVAFSGVVLIYKKRKELTITKQLGPMLLFILLYSGLILISSSTTAYDRIDNRILSPIMIPMVMLTFAVFDKILKFILKFPKGIIIYVLFIAGLIFWMENQFVNTYGNFEYYTKQIGWEYGSKKWKDNTVIQYLNDYKQFGMKYLFYSNVPEAVYILSNREARWSPFKTFYNSPQPISLNKSLNKIWRVNDKAYLVWFYNVNRDFLFTLNELQKSVKLEKIVQLKDGAIYLLSKN